MLPDPVSFDFNSLAPWLFEVNTEGIVLILIRVVFFFVFFCGIVCLTLVIKQQIKHAAGTKTVVTHS